MVKQISVCLLALLLGTGCCIAQVLRKRTVTLMGSRFDISLVGVDSLSAEHSIDTVIAEIDRIENLISEWRPESEISEVNRNAGIRPVKVSREVFELTKRSLYYSRITHGAFDISFAAMDKIWKFDGSMKVVPSPEVVRKSVEKVDYRNIILDSAHCTIFLLHKGMKIGFGSIGKGYAADRGRIVALEKGIEAGIVNASGDMQVWGTYPNGSDWVVGVADPFKPGEILKTIALNNGAITTSGSYEKYVLLDGKRYSHIIDPHTGYPVSGLCSVTILGPQAELANAFSTSIMVLGEEKGLGLLKQFPEYSCIMVTDTGEVLTTAMSYSFFK